ncbi:phosphatidylinositol-specific phospholipase C/glycerophosphodiester phosphodiesterase family protein [bacterium]|nr:phosphatidylinositol-specific phospholipase C/glycerophosphodiester phosphodiesterase family protein [bacterium]
MCKNNIIILSALCLLVFNQIAGQQKIHSHNDYHQNIPFWLAYGCGLDSIEVDVFLKDNDLMVAHHENEIIENRTIESLYLNPIRNLLSLNLDKQALQLLIDIKTAPYETIDRLVLILKKYPEITSNPLVSIVISGSQPKIMDYPNYPNYIKFDYQKSIKITDKNILDKVGLISLSLRKFSNWNGLSDLSFEDQEIIKGVIQKAHSYGKPFRFWATPDTEKAWKTFAQLGVDYINTDQPCQASSFLNTSLK